MIGHNLFVKENLREFPAGGPIHNLGATDAWRRGRAHHAAMPPEMTYRFRFFDDVRQRWVAARYRATEATIKDRYARYELVGDPQPQPSVGGHGNLMAHLLGPPKAD